MAISDTIKRIAAGANDASSPTAVLFGTVTQVSPLNIQVEQKMTLTEEFLILTKNVKDYTVDVTVNWSTLSESLNADHSHEIEGDIKVDSTTSIKPNPDNIDVKIENTVNNTTKIQEKQINLSHSHNIAGRMQMTVHNGLQINDRVILIQQQGGSNFVVLDKF